MCINNKMIKHFYVKIIKGAMIPLEGKRKGGPWESNPLFPSVNLKTHPNSIMFLE